MRARSNDSLVYSSDPARAREPAPRADAPAGSGDGVVRIWLERKGRNGGPVSIIRGLPNDKAALSALATRLKKACGTGGSAKDGAIIIQGDHRERIAAELARDGLRVKLAGG
jgi:translation initiation factor 1